MNTSFTLSLHTPPGQLLAHFAPHLHIAHQLPGRVRFKLAPAALKGVHIDPAASGGSDTVSAVLSQIHGVRDVGLNWLARSCTISYDPKVIPDAAWPDLLAGRDTPAAQTLHAILEEAHAQLRHAAAS